MTRARAGRATGKLAAAGVAGRFAAVGLALAMSACGASPARPSAVGPQQEADRGLRRMEGRPPLAIVARDGDPRAGIAVAVTTEGIVPERGAEVSVALAALVEARLGADASVVGATVVPSGDGFRARGLAADDAGARALVAALRSALLAPVAAADLGPVSRKLGMLARRPLADAALEPSAACEASVVAPAGTHGAGEAEVGAETVESWRRAAIGLGRVSIAVAGGAAVGEAAARAIESGPAWPAASAIPADPAPASDARVYDATGDVAAGAARVILSARAARADDAVRAAEALGDPNGALAARLGGLDAPARLRDVTATAHARGGCLVVSFDFAARDLAVDAPARIATAIALARQEIATELAPTPSAAPVAALLARRARDPRDAADLAAWWALSAPDPAGARETGEAHIATAIGLGTGREIASPLRGAAPADNAAVTSRADAVRSELDRAVLAWHEPVVESRTHVEPGQGDLWIALGSPCGTLAEMESDAGLGAAFALAAADRTSAALRGTGASADAWAGADGIGVVVHGPALPGESPEAQARRLADAVARAYAAEPVDRASVSHARARLLGEDGREDARALVTLADAIAPGHPSWIAPMGPADALGRSSDASVAARASALRAGPLRVAVVANTTLTQADAAVRAVDRWIVRRPGQSRACPVPSVPAPPHPATYAVDAPPGGGSEAWLALALPPGDKTAAIGAEWIAAALDGADGLLAHALGSGLARGWSARVVGGAHAAALVVRVDSAAGALDAAVAQVRALLDRVRQGSLSDADVARAAARIAQRDLAASLDPSRRVLALWRDPSASSSPPTPPASSGLSTSTSPAPPTLEALRSFASATLHDDALVIVAVRPPRGPLDRADHPAAPPKPS